MAPRGSASGGGAAQGKGVGGARVRVGGARDEAGADMVEGVRVFEEAHGVVDTPGSYRRLVVNCGHPAHATQKAAAQCRKRRNFGVRAASASGLGLMEPYAYLGAWLRAAALYSDAASGQSQAF